MTLSSLNITDTFTGTGANTPLPTTFTFYTSDQIVVTKRNLGSGEETVLVLDTDYSLVGGLGSTGTVTPLDGPADFPTTVEWEVKRQTPLTQGVDLVPNVDLPSAAIEEMGDRSRMIQQEQDAQRALDTATTRPRNYLFNGEMRLNERQGATYTTNNSYGLDRFRVLGQSGPTCRMSQTTTAPTGSRYALDISGVPGGLKFGTIQIIESEDCGALQGNTCSISFQARLRAAGDIINLRAAALYWDGTADAVSADPISAWNAGGTNPTLANDWNWAAEPTDDLAALTDSYQRYELAGIDIPATAENVAFFIWNENNTSIAGDGFLLSEVQLELGSIVHDFERVSIWLELDRCRRYFEHLPMANFGTYGSANATDQMSGMIRWQRKRTLGPGLTIDLTPGGGTNWLTINGGFTFPATVVVTSLHCHGGGIIQATMAAPLWTVGEPVSLVGNIPTAFVSVDAEL